MKILKKVRGGPAVTAVKKLLYPDDSADATRWASQWTAAQKRGALLFFYERKKRTQSAIGFRFVIGTEENGSVVGQEYSYAVGRQLL